MEIRRALSHRRGKWVNVAKELYQIQTERKALETNERKLKDKLKDLSKGMPSQGGGYLFTFTLRKGGISYEDIPQLKKVDLELYRKDDVPMWKLQQISQR